ncbi:unnamed protein product [Ascophyllum nodosum]
MFPVASARRAAGAPVASLVLGGLRVSQGALFACRSSSSVPKRLSSEPPHRATRARSYHDKAPPDQGCGGGRHRTPREEVARERERRSQENAKVPRFQPFGRDGGEGGRVAEGMFEQFGMRSAPKLSRAAAASAAEQEQRAIKWIELDMKMRPRAVAEMLEREPRIRQQSPEAMSPRLAWLKNRLRLSEEQVRSLVHRRPSLLCRDGMESKVRWLQETLGLDDDEAASMVASAPNLLSSGVEGGGMGAKLEWLSKRLRLSREELALVVTSCPQVMTSSVDGALEPRLRWLQDTLQIGVEALRERVLAHPWLLSLSKERKLEPTLEFLKSDLLLDEAGVRKTLFRQPRMFLTQLRPALASTVEWLCRGMSMTEDQASAVIRKDARLLLRSTEVLQSKVDFFSNEMGASLEDLKEVLVASPNVFLVSVELVLGPRVAAMRKVGFEPIFDLHWNVVAFGPTGEGFDDWLSRQTRRHRRT